MRVTLDASRLAAVLLLLCLSVAPAVAQDAPEDATPDDTPPAIDTNLDEDTQEDAGYDVLSRFRFGSYGRVQPAVDGDGGKGDQVRIVFPAPRVDESAYAEVEFGYLAWDDPETGLEVDTVITLGIGDLIFHYNGDFASMIALRNLYAEARDLFVEGFRIWGGSRMYRGDDIYLLDFWPLDNLNTYGFGAGYHDDDWGTRIDWHLGWNRVEDGDYQFQVIDVVDERFVGARDVVFLDRQRTITSLKIEQLFGDYETGGVGFKVKAYGEYHHIPAGTLRYEQPRTEEVLPADHGWVAGLQFGTWGWARNSFVNLFVRAAGGLAAYGETAIPFGVASDKTALDALELRLGLSANYEMQYFGVMLAAFARYFTDADGFEVDFDDGWDATVAARFMGFIGDYFTPGLEISWQGRRPNDISPVSGEQELANVVKLSVLPAVTFGEGMYARPQIRLNYTVSFLDQAAQNLFLEEDPLRNKEVVHFVGLAVEWWFNSSSYQ